MDLSLGIGKELVTYHGKKYSSLTITKGQEKGSSCCLLSKTDLSCIMGKGPVTYHGERNLSLTMGKVPQSTMSRWCHHNPLGPHSILEDANHNI